MKKYRGLLNKIAEEFQVCQGDSESDESWKARVLYSYLGRMAYASLSDHLERYGDSQESTLTISIAHFKRRIGALLGSFLELYPELSASFPQESEELSRKIYNLYFKTGCIYHTAYNLSPAAPSVATEGELRFERGMPLGRRQYFSGLGSYLPQGGSTEETRQYPSLAEMFNLSKDTLSGFWESLCAQADWKPLDAGEGMVYLPHRPPYGTWRNFPESGISIARSGLPGGYLYYLYQIKDGQLLGSQLPHWLVNDPFYGGAAYRMVSNACLASHDCLPAIRYQVDGAIASMRLGYLLPPAEQYLMELYSWPRSFFSGSSGFSRVFSLPVFQVLKAALEQKGYLFTEG